ncbi:16S rRNA (uracil(1498)-N(3))-methyltransferase [Iamia sp. SCSIO 61187]|uniref:16S rRNA (uracil(1498)-N(3))-methyltransferase n=1 Tax=Iamia sp. SCSIO 61187 TaxID=2722752 RepID=UPI001C630878|nr:RsmE family RNA methyltransferase [Iamia sp. SCSIO 61187]QYG93701.1 16S rRNA (uracil(1498)-N(3))-methyltransferase [Iamia sp. SCSIO 61187]
MLGRGTGPHVFVADLERPELDDRDRHHLAKALRLRPGDALTVSDGAGRWRAARFGAEVEVTGDVVDDPAPEPPVTIGLAPVKGQRPEWAVQKLTELGVDTIWLLVADRSVVRWEGARGAGHADRLARVAREAAMQSRRCRLPAIRVGVPVADALTSEGVALADPGGSVPTLARPVVLVGPEGGWSDAERAAAPARVALGPTVLRAETAAVAAGGLLVALRHGLVAEGPAPSSTHGG